MRFHFALCCPFLLARLNKPVKFRHLSCTFIYRVARGGGVRRVVQKMLLKVPSIDWSKENANWNLFAYYTYNWNTHNHAGPLEYVSLKFNLHLCCYIDVFLARNNQFFQGKPELTLQLVCSCICIAWPSYQSYCDNSMKNIAFHYYYHIWLIIS